MTDEICIYWYNSSYSINYTTYYFRPYNIAIPEVPPIKIRPPPRNSIKKLVEKTLQVAMAFQPNSKKRKAVTRDAPEADEVLLSDGGDDFDAALLNGIQSLSEDELDEEDENTSSFASEGDSDLEDAEGAEVDIISDEIPSDSESDVADLKQDRAPTTGDKEDAPANYKITEDANGNPRYIYAEIEIIYDTEDSEAPATQNTIGNIPLSFYDSYPHIGYDINGKKIARPAKGEALDALLDSIEVPKGWTGLSDPATGQPLELSQQEYVLSVQIPLLKIRQISEASLPRHIS